MQTCQPKLDRFDYFICKGWGTSVKKCQHVSVLLKLFQPEVSAFNYQTQRLILSYVQAVVRLYDIPNNTFESDESEEESSSEEDEEADEEEEEGAVEPNPQVLENGIHVCCSYSLVKLEKYFLLCELSKQLVKASLVAYDCHIPTSGQKYFWIHNRGSGVTAGSPS